MRTFNTEFLPHAVRVRVEKIRTKKNGEKVKLRISYAVTISSEPTVVDLVFNFNKDTGKYVQRLKKSCDVCHDKKEITMQTSGYYNDAVYSAVPCPHCQPYFIFTEQL